MLFDLEALLWEGDTDRFISDELTQYSYVKCTCDVLVALINQNTFTQRFRYLTPFQSDT